MTHVHVVSQKKNTAPATKSAPAPRVVAAPPAPPARVAATTDVTDPKVRLTKEQYMALTTEQKRARREARRVARGALRDRLGLKLARVGKLLARLGDRFGKLGTCNGISAGLERAAVQVGIAATEIGQLPSDFRFAGAPGTTRELDAGTLVVVREKARAAYDGLGLDVAQQLTVAAVRGNKVACVDAAGVRGFFARAHLEIAQ